MRFAPPLPPSSSPQSLFLDRLLCVKPTAGKWKKTLKNDLFAALRSPFRTWPDPWRIFAQNKRTIEAVMDMLEKGSEVLASSVGDIFPFCEVAGAVVQLGLDKVQSPEVIYVKEQFVTMQDKMDHLSRQQENIECEMRKADLDTDLFSAEENIRHQFRKYVDFLEAREQFREVKKKLFLDHFSKSGGEKNLWTLYNETKRILEVVERYVERSRRPLEDFCVRLKELLCLGLFALMGHCALTQRSREEKIQEWRPRMEEIESQMKSAVESCVAAFPEQALSDVKNQLLKKEAGNPQPVVEQLLEFLVKKFDWVCWSVRLVNHPDGFFKKHCTGKPFHHVAGQTKFEVSWGNNVQLVVSYSTDPRPVPRDDVQQAMEGLGRKGNPLAVVEMLETKLSGFVIHAVSSQCKPECAYSFPEDKHYWEKHKNGVVCVHSE
ncbi:hypothetical protein OJAV_G00165810 [Oryzias javanicus]|uniref:Uncharacterized protein n=1 Tax=Oryzias javanicus TaxID=123683 RepID=A0A3S2LXC7_ORYJA|nr:hypothetical protein OJAV_G00165810 [Oryzias javanicus]